MPPRLLRRHHVAIRTRYCPPLRSRPGVRRPRARATRLRPSATDRSERRSPRPHPAHSSLLRRQRQPPPRQHGEHVDGKRVPRWRRRSGTIRAAEIGRKQQRFHAGRDEVISGEDRDHAGQRRGGGGVDGDDPRVRMGRAEKGDVRFARGVDVVGEAALAGQKRFVLHAAYRLAAAKARKLRRRSCHRSILPCASDKAVRNRQHRLEVKSSYSGGFT